MSHTTLFVYLAVLGMPAAPIESPDHGVSNGRATERLHTIERHVSDALRLEAKAKDSTGRDAAIRQLIALHQQLGTDRRLETSRTLKQLRIKLRARLRRIEQELARDIARQTENSPGEWVGTRGGRAQQAPNNAQALVELIQTTISPDSWDVNGGESTVFYYAPRHALVIRAPAEVHSRTRRLLIDLR